MSDLIKLHSYSTDTKYDNCQQTQGVTNATFPVIFVIMQTGDRANGGVESITQVIERLKGIKAIVITQIEAPVNSRWRNAGAEVKVWQIPYHISSSFNQSSFVAKWQRIQSLLETNYRIYKLIKSTNSRVIHCNDPSALWHSALGAKMAKAKIIFNIRDMKPDNEQYGLRWQIAFRKLSNYQLVLSKEMGESFANRLSISQHTGEDKQGTIRYIYSIVDTSKMQPVSARKREEIRGYLGINPDCLALGYVAVFNEKKAQLDFIEKAGLLLKTSITKVKIYFIGDFEPSTNEYAKFCLDAVKKLGLEDNISFVGYTSQVVDWYRSLDLIVVASRTEGLARCMIESLACGTPIVSFDVCSAREILEQNNCGFVVNQGDYTTLVKQIAYLAENRNICHSLGEKGAFVARELFNPVHIVQQYQDLYSSLNVMN